jgi:glycosyltransferase involved in cell wall biosynthesis
VQALRKRLDIADDEVMLLYVGRLNPHHQPYKGTADLLASFAALQPDIPSARLVMAGFGTDDDAEWVRSGGAIALPNAPVEDMPALFGAADLYVTASRWEGFDLPAVEAQRAGTPVVAFRVGAHPEVIDDGASGILVESTRGFTDAIRNLVRDDGRRTDMALRAREWALQFRWEEAVARYDDVVSSMVSGRSPARAGAP